MLIQPGRRPGHPKPGAEQGESVPFTPAIPGPKSGRHAYMSRVASYLACALEKGTGPEEQFSHRDNHCPAGLEGIICPKSIPLKHGEERETGRYRIPPGEAKQGVVANMEKRQSKNLILIKASCDLLV